MNDTEVKMQECQAVACDQQLIYYLVVYNNVWMLNMHLSTLNEWHLSQPRTLHLWERRGLVFDTYLHCLPPIVLPGACE